MKLVAELEQLGLNQESDTQTASQKSIELIGELVASEKARQGDLYTHDRFFKRRTSNETIRGLAEGIGSAEMENLG